MAQENGVEVGRIYQHRYGGRDRDTWLWTATGIHRGRYAEGVAPLSGDTDTRDEAIEALSAAWARAKAWSARTGLPLA